MTTIDLNRIATFVRVAETGSFTAAARALRSPVSSVSRAVAHLEQELGVRLLHRTTRRLSLTDAGQHFCRRMSAVITETEEATRAVMGFAGETRGVVRITASPDLGQHQLPRILQRITARHPGLSFELLLTTRIVDLVADGIDLAIRAGVLPDSSLVARKVRDSELALYAAPSYLAQRGRPRSLADLTQHDCLCYAGRAGKLPWRLSGPGGDKTVSVNGPVMCDDMIFLREAAIAGLGIALIPSEIVIASVRQKQLVRLLPRYRQGQGAGVYVVWPSQKLVPAPVVTTRELLIEELGQAYA